MTPASPKLRLAATVLGLFLLLGLGWAAFGPVGGGSRQQLFEIPPGTHERRMAGDHAEILPQTIRLTLGVKDVLVFKNSDKAPHIFGPTLIMPGQSFSLPFEMASTYSFQCTAHANGQLNIIVDPEPIAGWQRLKWRMRHIVEG